MKLLNHQMNYEKLLSAKKFIIKFNNYYCKFHS